MLWLIVEILSGLKKSLLSLHVLLSVDNVDSLVGNFIEANTLKVVDCIVALLAVGTYELCSRDGAAIDEGRIATEVTIYADKICVDEETVRLRSHIEHTRQTLLDGDSIGRKLDFIAQEMNREANTILSKANDLDISNIAIDLKTEIEKVREQIQNIE